MAQRVKNVPANAGDIRDTGLIPGSGRCPTEGNGNPLQYFCLENSMDRGAWQATVPASSKKSPDLSKAMGMMESQMLLLTLLTVKMENGLSTQNRQNRTYN